MDAPSYDLEGYRSQVPLLETAVPMNHCSQAPQSHRTRAAALRYLDGWNERGMDWEEWIGEVEAARAAFARLVGAEPDDVAVGSSVSQLISSLAGALDFSGARNQVVAADAEFPTVGQVWRAQERRGAVLEAVPGTGGKVDEEEFVRRVGERTLVVSIPHGLYESGFVVDPGSICAAAQAAGALTVLDAYQTLGTRAVNVADLGVDVLVSGCLKYLMGVPGLAFMYLRRSLADQLFPTTTGWFGRVQPFAFTPTLDWADGARRFDLGTPPIMEAFVCRAGIEWILEAGPAPIQAWTTGIAARLVERGREAGLTLHGTDRKEWKTPCTAFRLENAAAVEAAMRQRGVIASARGPVLRFAPHFYSTLDDVDRAFDALGAVLPA